MRWAPRFTLRALLAAMLVATVALALVGRTVREWLAINSLRRGGCYVECVRQTAADEENGPYLRDDWLGRPSAAVVGGPCGYCCDKWTDESAALFDDVHSLESLTSLKTLLLENASPSLVSAVSLQRFPHLELLTICANPSGVDSVVALTETRPKLTTNLTPLASLTKLERLTIAGFALDRAQLAAIGKAPSLQRLDLADCDLPPDWLTTTKWPATLTSLEIGRFELTIFDAAALPGVVGPTVLSMRSEPSDEVRAAFQRLAPHVELRGPSDWQRELERQRAEAPASPESRDDADEGEEGAEGESP